VGLPDQPGAPGVPVALVHGRQDETVDHQASVAYALAHPGVELHLVEGDHRLTEPRHEDLIAWCARDLIARTAG
jgi:surfactin synthase thioesterase subunit